MDCTAPCGLYLGSTLVVLEYYNENSTERLNLAQIMYHGV